jgi:hypothetical protein
LKKNIFEDQNF